MGNAPMLLPCRVPAACLDNDGQPGAKSLWREAAMHGKTRQRRWKWLAGVLVVASGASGCAAPDFPAGRAPWRTRKPASGHDCLKWREYPARSGYRLRGHYLAFGTLALLLIVPLTVAILVLRWRTNRRPAEADK